MKYKILKRIALVVSVVLISVLVLPIIPIEARPPAMTQDYIIIDRYAGDIPPRCEGGWYLGDADRCRAFKNPGTSRFLKIGTVYGGEEFPFGPGWYLMIKNPDYHRTGYYDVTVQLYYEFPPGPIPRSTIK